VKRILILHGIYGRAGENWGQWLSNELHMRGHEVIMPTLPHADHPDRTEWLAAIRQYAADNVDLVIVAHSLGVTSALDFIEQLSVHALVSVSGFAGDYGAELNSYFLREKHIDFVKVNAHLKQAAVLYGNDDPYVPQTSLRALAHDLGVVPTVVPSGGHCNQAAGYGPFPLLLKIIEELAA